jgi:hypothetical protein
VDRVRLHEESASGIAPHPWGEWSYEVEDPWWDGHCFASKWERP